MSSLVVDRYVVGAHDLVRGSCKGLRANLGKALAHDGLVRRGLFPRVLLHLGVNERRDLSLMEQQNVANLALVLEVGPEVGYDLARELVEKVRLLVVADVVEVDEATHDIVLEPLLVATTFERADDLARVAREVLDQDLLRDRLEAE